MAAEQVDKQVIEIGNNFKYVKYTYRYLAPGEVKTKKEKSESNHDFEEKGRFQTTIYDGSGKAIGWIAEHMYKRKTKKEIKRKTKKETV